jgi:hypothetical protein
MNDEAEKRRSWGRIGWAMLAFLVLYPLSAGPALWACAHFDSGWVPQTYGVVYTPLNWVHGLSETFDNALMRYLNWWMRR